MESIPEDDDPEQIADDASHRNPQDELARMASLVSGAGESSSSSSAKPLVKKARKLLFRRMRVGVEDGRVFLGKFHCLDKQGNIILYDTTEYRAITSDSASSSATSLVATEQRSLGLVLIPARWRTSCSVECSLAEQLSLLSL